MCQKDVNPSEVYSTDLFSCYIIQSKNTVTIFLFHMPLTVVHRPFTSANSIPRCAWSRMLGWWNPGHAPQQQTVALSATCETLPSSTSSSSPESIVLQAVCREFACARVQTTAFARISLSVECLNIIQDTCEIHLIHRITKASAARCRW